MQPRPPGNRNHAVVIVCDVCRVSHPDERTLDALARLQLAARRHCATLRLLNACPTLVDLIECAGLGDVLVVVPAESGVEMQGEVEEREECRVDEGILLDDDTL